MPSGRERSIDGSHFSPDTLEFIRLLDKHNVKYVVVGGEAVIFHGHVRFTGDVDFFYSDETKNVRALFQALNEFWAGAIPGIEKPEELLEPGVIVQFGRPPHRIDLMNRIDGVGFEEDWIARLELAVAFQGSQIPLAMLSLEKLIQNKRAAGRPKDADDLKFLERTARQS
jgi:hypothetical protein